MIGICEYIDCFEANQLNGRSRKEARVKNRKVLKSFKQFLADNEHMAKALVVAVIGSK